MRLYEMVLTGVTDVPDDVKEVLGLDGQVIAFELPDGRTLKPWIVFELHDPSNDSYQDMSEGELVEKGIQGFMLEQEGMDIYPIPCEETDV